MGPIPILVPGLFVQQQFAGNAKQQLLLTDGDITPPSEATLNFDGACRGNHGEPKHAQ